MAIIEITYGELLDFVIENGYTIALYNKGKDGNWHLFERDDTSYTNNSYILLANRVGNGTNMNETVSKDKKCLFKLHNNCNLPEVITCSL